MAILEVDDSSLGQSFNVLTQNHEEVRVTAVEASGGGTFVVLSTPGVTVVPIPPDATYLETFVMNAGAGGGSGRCGTNVVARGGGGGGAAGNGSRVVFAVAELLLLGPAITATVGSGGLGGAAVGPVATNGQPGLNGAASTLEISGVQIQTGGPAALGGTGGAAANTAGGAASAVGTAMFPGGPGGASSVTVGAPQAPASQYASGGGGGGGATAAGVGLSAGNGGAIAANPGVVGIGGSPAQSGLPGTAPPSLGARFGGGGGGGASGTQAAGTVSGGAGGPGATWGGGGGGGGICTEAGTATSGPGGRGGDGGIVLTFF